MGLQREIIAPKDPALGVPRNLDLPLSPAIRAGAFVFVSGLVAIDPATGERMHGTVATETRQILAAMTQVLEAAGSSLEKVVKANVLIYSMLEYNNMNEVYREFFPVDPPARTVCGAQLSGGSKVEIECIALA
jgi:2-iminobutanoate/2-iminopropanoate deaminase